MNIKELAALAGVSSSAVSRYLNGGSLSQEKRDRISKAIEETGYQPDVTARMLRTKNTNYVGLIIPKLDSDAVSRVTRGASTALAEAGYLGLLADTGSDPEKEIAYIKLFEQRNVAGIIMMATVMTPQHEELLKNSSVPIVIVGQRFSGVPCVYHDDYGAAYALTKLMLKKGRKKIAFIGVDTSDVAVGQNRKRGIQDAMRNFGLDPESLIFKISDFTIEGGNKAMTELLDEGAEFDGLIGATDRIAFGAIEVLKNRGIQIPEKISIAGFDDNWFCNHVTPHLTSVHFYYKTSGEMAVSLLLDMIGNKDNARPVLQTMQGFSVKERDSI